MTKAKPKSEFHKGTRIPTTLLDELMDYLPAMPTQEDLFGFSVRFRDLMLGKEALY